MARFSYEEADQYGAQNYDGNKINYFTLKDDGDKAYVHLLGDDMNDFPGYAVHRVYTGSKDGKDFYKYVNCLRNAGAPITDCPLCALGKSNEDVSKVYAKLFIPLYNCDTDRVEIWERGKQFFRTLASHCSHNPHVSEIVTEVERQGKARDTSTTYGLYATREDDGFKMENIADDIPNILGDVILDKSYDELDCYAKTGKFPDSNNNNASVQRRSDVRDSGVERRTMSSRTRRSVEDEY